MTMILLAPPRERASIVAPAQSSPAARRKRASKLTADGRPVHSFQTLLRHLATCTLNEMTTTLSQAYSFTLVAHPNPNPGPSLHSARGRSDQAVASNEHTQRNFLCDVNNMRLIEVKTSGLTKDREALLAFYDFPAEHWKHLRTTNPIESTFATVRHRTVRSKGCLSSRAAIAMVFKLAQAAEKGWRRLDGHNQCQS